MKNYHSIRYYEKRLYKLQNVADTIGYDIDENKAYKAACKALPVPGYNDTSSIPDAFLGRLMRLVKPWKWQEGSVNNAILL